MKRKKQIAAHKVDHIVDRYLEINRQIKEMLTKKEWEALKNEIKKKGSDNE